MTAYLTNSSAALVVMDSILQLVLIGLSFLNKLQIYLMGYVNTDQLFVLV